MNVLENKLKLELIAHVIETINNQEMTDFEELHFHAFNEDYYIIGYYRASEWLKEHNIDAFEAIAYILEKENDMFGEVQLKPEDMNSEKVVNLLTYYLGEDLLSDFDLEQDAEGLLNDLKGATK